MRKMTVYEIERLRREVRTYMDIHYPERRSNYAVKLAQIQRRMQRRRAEGPLTKLMVWLAVRREMRAATKEMAAHGY